MTKHRGELPITATKVAHRINRSSGAVGKCLGRLEKEKRVRLASKKPRDPLPSNVVKPSFADREGHLTHSSPAETP
jgi:hypothetical protein